MIPKIDLRLCMGCGLCEYVCFPDVIRMRGKKAYVAYPDDCGLCWLCMKACPVGAITWQDSSPEFEFRRVEFSADFAWKEHKRAWGIATEKATGT